MAILCAHRSLGGCSAEGRAPNGSLRQGLAPKVTLEQRFMQNPGLIGVMASSIHLV